MDSWTKLAIIASVLALVYIVFVIMTKRQVIKTLHKIKANLQFIDENAKIDLFDYDNSFQIMFETEKELYLIKVLNINVKQELIITNSHKWGINKNIKNFKRSTAPFFVPLVPEFLNYESPSKKLVKKVALINPNCHNIVKYLNESDAITVNHEKPIDGVYFVKYNNLRDFFKKH